MKKKIRLPRRSFLRGVAGTAIALPLLECMMDDAQAQTAPMRYFVSQGGFSLNKNSPNGPTQQAFEPNSSIVSIRPGCAYTHPGFRHLLWLELARGGQLPFLEEIVDVHPHVVVTKRKVEGAREIQSVRCRGFRHRVPCGVKRLLDKAWPALIQKPQKGRSIRNDLLQGPPLPSAARCQQVKESFIE